MMYKKLPGDVHHYSTRDYSKRIAFLVGVLYGLFISLVLVLMASYAVLKWKIDLFK